MLALLLAGCATPAQQQGPSPTTPSASDNPAHAVQAPGIRFTTDLGVIALVLYPQAAPHTVELMQQLVREGYYNGREFTRVIPGFVIQLVDKAGGATDDPRRVPIETASSYHFSAGAAGTARGDDPRSGGPEFFLMDYATGSLDGNYTVWGQVIQGLEVVHRAARVPSVPTGAIPGVNEVATDQTAVKGAIIQGAELMAVNLTAEQAAQLPMQVARNIRAGDFRHSVEWPANLQPGKESALTWYVRPYNDTVMPPKASEARIRADSQEVTVQGDPEANGAFHWQWAPSKAGVHNITFEWRGQAMATLQVSVQPAGVMPAFANL